MNNNNVPKEIISLITSLLLNRQEPMPPPNIEDLRVLLELLEHKIDEELRNITHTGKNLVI